MNPTAMSLAQSVFQAALNSGSSTAPVGLSQFLAKLSSDSLPQTFDAETVGHNTGDEFPFLRNMITLGTSPDAAASAAWEAAVRWVLNALRNWDPNEANSLNKLCALLAALAALDAGFTGFSCVATQLDSSRLKEGLRQLLERTSVDAGLNELRFPELRQEIESCVSSRNLERLWQVLRHIHFFPTSDVCVAVVFMYNADPAVLAGIIERRNDVLFSLMICSALGDQALVLAPRVDNLFFKFVSIENFRQEHTTSSPVSSQNTLQVLLHQVAQTSAADWTAWMQALFKYPGNFSSLEAALSAVLQQLSLDHWTAFFKALSLGYSHRAAVPVAAILIPCSGSASEGMWSAAYQVWLEWNYGQCDSGSVMFAPVACALDFPVSMYYASLPSNIRLTEESSLLSAIETLEQQWFDSATALITERNRLKSRLRLVQHGMTLANGGTPTLPPPIQPEADLYSRIRYHYHDINSGLIDL
ncbi:hypothetical protein [Alcaligenes sp. SJTW-7]|uniref:hypothetical protein n=1 Tax=Alcaligenes sp. SJTW-7 TaxID=3078429 RepID=UPI0039E7D58A